MNVRCLLSGITIVACCWNLAGVPSAAATPDTAKAGEMVRRSLAQHKTDLPTARSLGFGALEIYRAARDSSGIAKAYEALAVCFGSLGRHDSVEMYLRQAIALNRAVNPRSLGSNYYYLSILYMNRGQQDAARQAAICCINYGIAYRSMKDFSDGLMFLAIVSVQQNRLSEAIEYFYGAREFKKTMGDLPGVANCNLNLGIIYGMKEDFIHALSFVLKAQTIREKANSSHHDKVAILNNLGLCYDGMGEYRKAIACYAEARRIIERAGKSFDIARVYINLGEAYRKLGMPDSASHYLDQAMQVYSGTSPHPEGLSHIYIRRSKIYQTRGEYGSAITSSLKAMELSRTHGIIPGIADAAYQLYLAYAATGQHSKALRYLEEYGIYKDSLDNAKHLQQLESARYDDIVNDRDRKILELKHETAIKKQENRFQRIYMAGISLICILIGGFSLYYHRQAKLRGFINRKLTAQKEAISRYAGELEASNRTKHRIISVISHDVKAPITSLHHLLELHNRRAITAESLPGIMTNLKQSVCSVSMLLENLLGWARHQLGAGSSRMVDLLLSEAVEDAIALYQPIAGDKDVRFMVDLPRDLSIRADREHLDLIFRNLISNAVKFSPSGGVIRIESGLRAGSVQISISDEGQGLDAEQVHRFNKGGHLDPTPGTRNEKGYGLGLTLVRDSVRTMGGSVTVSSAPGAGAHFEVLLPLTPAGGTAPFTGVQPLHPERNFV